MDGASIELKGRGWENMTSPQNSNLRLKVVLQSEGLYVSYGHERVVNISRQRVRQKFAYCVTRNFYITDIIFPCSFRHQITSSLQHQISAEIILLYNAYITLS